jgi:hypothetical protein
LKSQIGFREGKIMDNGKIPSDPPPPDNPPVGEPYTSPEIEAPGKDEPLPPDTPHPQRQGD